MKEIYKRIADIHNTEPKEIEEEISKAIALAMNCDSEEAVAFWGRLAPKGEQPSNEAVIESIIALLLKSNND